MHATFQHQSDGAAPTKVFSVAPGGNFTRLEPSRWEEMVEGCAPSGVNISLPQDGTGIPAVQLQAVTDALLAATRDMGTSTRERPRKPDPKKRLVTTEQIVARMRVTYPTLVAAKLDQGLMHFVLSELMTQAVNSR